MGAKRTIPLALTMGEPAGIGPELSLMAWRAAKDGTVPPFAYVGDGDHLARLARSLGLDIPLAAAATMDEAADLFARALPVVPVTLAAAPDPGRPDPANAAAVAEAIETAVRLCLDGEAAAVVTNPIQKSAMYEGGFAHPGHTEYLAHLAPGGAARNRAVMMLACAELRTVPVTVHVPIRAVPEALNTTLIVETGAITAEALSRHFAIAGPRLAVAGLNPHAGEGGTIGDEDEEVVRPAVEALRARGIDAGGPYPADTLFHASARARYDAALCMYHDQALVPVKTLAFEEAVNVTLGLPFVRTSPDHGTALDVAGTGTADPTSLLAALRLAWRMAERAHSHADAEAAGSAAG